MINVIYRCDKCGCTEGHVRLVEDVPFAVCDNISCRGFEPIRIEPEKIDPLIVTDKM